MRQQGACCAVSSAVNCENSQHFKSFSLYFFWIHEYNFWFNMIDRSIISWHVISEDLKACGVYNWHTCARYRKYFEVNDNPEKHDLNSVPEPQGEIYNECSKFWIIPNVFKVLLQEDCKIHRRDWIGMLRQFKIQGSSSYVITVIGNCFIHACM